MSVAVVTDVAIPVASILVPTVVAIVLAKGERRRSISERAEERRQIQLDAREERRRAAIDRVFDCLLDSMITDQELDSDAAVMKVRRLNSSIGRLSLALGDSEAWLVDWLAAEHTGLAITQAGAKLRKTSQKNTPAERANRLALLARYVMRANKLSEHIVEYETAGRIEALARQWQAEAEAYVADPLSAT